MRQRRRAASRAAGEAGAAVLETALVSVFLLLLLAGALDVGRMFYSYIVITNAAREGARTAARLPCSALNNAQVRAAILLAAEQETGALPGDPPGDVTIQINPNPASGCFTAGNTVTVTVSYEYTNLLTGITGSTGVEMSNYAVMVAFGNDQVEAKKP
jgi:Flp pilus assembly protein TadG